MPRLGTRKLHYILSNEGLIIGRDSLFNLLGKNNMLVKRRKNYTKTTNSRHKFKKHGNLIDQIEEIDRKNKLWVSDITYIWTLKGYVYLFLITDAYSRKIVGYEVSQGMESKNALRALEMALKELPKKHELIHHSDRGIQYCSKAYIEKLESMNIRPSMTQNSDPLENSIAERVNGILKNEWLKDFDIKDYDQAKSLIKRVIKIYNERRPHLSQGYQVPSVAHEKVGQEKRMWKNYYKERIELSTEKC